MNEKIELMANRIHLGVSYLDKLIVVALFLNHGYSQSEALAVIGLQKHHTYNIIDRWIEMFRRDRLISRDGWFVESKENFCSAGID